MNTTIKQVKQTLDSINFDMIYSDFFNVEIKNTDAGMGGYNYIQVSYDKDLAASKKRSSDVKMALNTLKAKFNDISYI
jgi:hypothetical protein